MIKFKSEQTKTANPPMQLSMQQDLLVALIWSESAFRRIRKAVDPNLFSTDIYRDIVRRVYKYIDRYDKPPKVHFHNLIEDQLKNKKTGELYRGILQAVNGTKESLNAEYVINQLEQFVRLQNLKLGVIKAVEAIQAGDTDAADATLRKAIGAKAGPINGFDTHIETVRGSEIRMRAVRWLWSDRIPRGKLTLVVGDPEGGKTTLLLNLAARFSVGKPWPDGAEAQKGKVLYVSSEDDATDTLVPRFKAAGGDPDRIHFVQMVTRRDPKTGEMLPGEFSLQDVEPLRRAIQEIKNIGLVILDPVSTGLGKTDANVDAQVRALLAPIIKLAQAKNFALVGIGHLNKATGAHAMYRALGSIGWVAASRAVYLVAKDQDDEPEDERDRRRLFLKLKNNLAPDKGGLAFRIGQRELKELPGVKHAVIEWEQGEVRTTAAQALAEPKPHKETQRSAVEAKLKEMLADEPMLASKALRQLTGEGYSKSVVFRARDAIGATSVKQGKGWVWQLPAPKHTLRFKKPRGTPHEIMES